MLKLLFITAVPALGITIAPATGLAVQSHEETSGTVQPPSGSKLLVTARAVGYQIYSCQADGQWSGAEPIAALISEDGQAIRHFRDTSPAVPTWEAADGSKVHAVLKGGKPDQSIASFNTDSIPQLGLNATPVSGTGLLTGVTYVIRSETNGGMHPSGACNLPSGKRFWKRYEAEYRFYGSGK